MAIKLTRFSNGETLISGDFGSEGRLSLTLTHVDGCGALAGDYRMTEEENERLNRILQTFVDDMVEALGDLNRKVAESCSQDNSQASELSFDPNMWLWECVTGFEEDDDGEE